MASQQPMETDPDLAIGVFILQSLECPSRRLAGGPGTCRRLLAVDGTRNHYGGPPTCRVVIGSMVALLHGCAVSGTRSASGSVPAKLSDTRDARAMAAPRS